VSTDPWSVLGIEPSVTYEEARQAYRRRSRLLHPDRHPEADTELREEAERAMAALNDAWEEIASLLNRKGAEPPLSPARPSDNRRGQNQSEASPSDELSTPDECLDWALGALIEGGQLEGDPLSSSEITRVMRPISKEAGKSSFDVWLAHRTATLRRAIATDMAAEPDEATKNWTRCYECLDHAQSDRVIMMMLDELLDDGTG
jgi:curved DNA-binding protein CbpA